MTTTTRFETRDYRLAHGKEPRGRGTWAFSENRAADGASSEVLWSKYGTYTEAKADVLQQIKALGGHAEVLWVLS